MLTPSIDHAGIFDLTHEEYLANFLRDCESREWSKFMAGYTSRNQLANKALTNHVSAFQDFIESSDRAQEIRRVKEYEDSLVQTAKKAHNRKGYESYLSETHLFTLPAAELIERESSDWGSIQRIRAKSYNFSAERKVSEFISEWKNSEFRPAAEEKLKAIRDAMREAEDRLAYMSAKTLDELRAYLDNWPDGKFRNLAKTACEEINAERHIAQEQAWRDIGFFGKVSDYERFINLFPDAEQVEVAKERIKALGLIDQIRAMQGCYFEGPRPRPLDGNLIKNIGNEKRLIVGLTDLVGLNTGDHFSEPWFYWQNLRGLRNDSKGIGLCLSPLSWAFATYDSFMKELGENDTIFKFGAIIFSLCWVICSFVTYLVSTVRWPDEISTIMFLAVFLAIPAALGIGLGALYLVLSVIIVFIPLLARAVYEIVLIYLFDKTHILFRRDVEEFDRLMKERSS